MFNTDLSSRGRSQDKPLSNMAAHFLSPNPDATPATSGFARVGLLLYTFLIIYASWYPFSGWHSVGMTPFAYLFAPLPYYWTLFDLATNMIGYLPLGVLGVFSLYPQLRGQRSVLLVVLCGMLLSALMEAVQTYLPSRVPSNLDLLSNSAGVLIGAVIGVVLTPTFLIGSRLLLLRRRWFNAAAGRGLIVLGLWPLAQIFPQGYLFGHGQLLPIFSDWLTQLLHQPVDLSALLRPAKALTIQQYWLSETIITACGLIGALLMLMCLLREQAPQFRLIFLFIATTLAAKILASALQFSPDFAFLWATPGAQSGLLLGLLILSGLSFSPPQIQRRIAALTLVLSLAAVNAAPANPYFLATMQTWVQGKFLNFNGAAQFLSLLWPFLSLWFLFHPSHQHRQD